MPPKNSNEDAKQPMDPGSLPGSIAAEIKSKSLIILKPTNNAHNAIICMFVPCFISGRGGVNALKKVETKNEANKGEGGVFIDPAAQELLQKAKTNKEFVTISSHNTDLMFFL